MKRKFKRIASLVLAMVMVFAMAMPAMATAPDPKTASMEGHTFNAYQIFSGTQAKEGGALGNIEWGNGVKSDAFLKALQDDETLGAAFKDAKTAAEVAEVVAGWQSAEDWKGEADSRALAFAKIAYDNRTATKTDANETLAAGYYLIVDETDFGDGADNVRNLSLLYLTKPEKFEPKVKTDVPEVQKKVEEINDSTGVNSGWKDAADYDIKDSINFQLTGTLPTDYANYRQYKYVFHDTLSDGLTYNGDVKVYVVNGGVRKEVSASLYTVDPSEGGTKGGTLKITIDDLKAAGFEEYNITADTMIVVEYSATLNEEAVVGPAGNDNKVYLEYSNNPDQEAGGTPETGHTPEDTVVVFTFQSDVDKLDEKGDALAGAEFTLLKWTEGTPNLEKGDKEATDTEGNTYPAPEGGKTPGFWKDLGLFTKTDSEGTKFSFKGLDAGIYKLVESTTPAGYNTLEPVDFTIASALEDGPEPSLKDLTVDGGGFEALTDDSGVTGVVKSDVENKKGSTLPETGGIGTTIFYVVGSVLVLGAVILLVTKRRMKG